MVKKLFLQNYLSFRNNMGAIQDIEFNSLSEDKKKELKEFSDFLKK